MFKISNRKIGYGQTPFLSAELGLNHNADLDTALRMIETVKECGADGVKVQYFKVSDFSSPYNGKTVNCKIKDTSNDLALINNDGIKHTRAQVYGGKPSYLKTEKEYDFFKRHEISIDFVEECYHKAKQLDLVFGVTTTSAEGVKEVSSYTDYFKVASDMVFKLDMLNQMTSYNIPVIISTGHLRLEELEKYSKILLFLHCISEYPCSNPKLWKIKHMQELGYLTGYSHHRQGIEDIIRACELGSIFNEFHFTLDKEQPGSDHWWSVDEAELKQLVRAIKCTSTK